MFSSFRQSQSRVAWSPQVLRNLYMRGNSRQSWQRLQNTQAVNCDSIQNSAGEKMSFANLINLSKVASLGYSCKSSPRLQ
jgi:hypothetical protein